MSTLEGDYEVSSRTKQKGFHHVEVHKHLFIFLIQITNGQALFYLIFARCLYSIPPLASSYPTKGKKWWW